MYGTCLRVHLRMTVHKDATRFLSLRSHTHCSLIWSTQQFIHKTFTLLHSPHTQRDRVFLTCLSHSTHSSLVLSTYSWRHCSENKHWIMHDINSRTSNLVYTKQKYKFMTSFYWTLIKISLPGIIYIQGTAALLSTIPLPPCGFHQRSRTIALSSPIKCKFFHWALMLDMQIGRTVLCCKLIACSCYK